MKDYLQKKHGSKVFGIRAGYFYIFVLFILMSGVYLASTQKIWDSVMHDKTNFPLIGKHKTVSCSECHKKGILDGTPSECESCHKYRRNDDPHSSQLGIHCGDCHTPIDWKIVKPGSWSHTMETGFQLNGQHRITDCRQCHKNNIYTIIDSTCDNCHIKDYKQTKNPNHISAGYSTDCIRCHNENAIAWEGAAIDHNQFWPLRGPHLGHDCSRCHSSGYNITSDCISCHRDDFESAREPDHVKAGFSTDCSLCHLEDSFSWSQVLFYHGFPVNSGVHQHLVCSDCHVTSNYYEFSCINCHEHERSEMDAKHSGISGYEYSSRNCYFCHPEGN